MDSQLNRLKMVENFIEGFETSFGMELLSTIYWVVKYDGVSLSDENPIVDKVHAWNPRKALSSCPVSSRGLFRVHVSEKSKSGVDIV